MPSVGVGVGAGLGTASDLCPGGQVMHDINSLECLCLLLGPDELCDCHFVDPVASLTTALSSQGDALVQLAECRVTLARLPHAHLLLDRSTRLTRSQVPFASSQLASEQLQFCRCLLAMLVVL